MTFFLYNYAEHAVVNHQSLEGVGEGVEDGVGEGIREEVSELQLLADLALGTVTCRGG